jgi:hypothetical protein
VQESSSQEMCLSCTHPNNKHVCKEHQVSNNSSLVATPSGLKPAHLKHIGCSEITQESSALIVVKEVRINPLQYIQ